MIHITLLKYQSVILNSEEKQCCKEVVMCPVKEVYLGVDADKITVTY